MREHTEFEGKHVLVVGLARSGIAAAELLVRLGAVVTVNDSKPESELGEEVLALRKLNLDPLRSASVLPLVIMDSVIAAVSRSILLFLI